MTIHLARLPIISSHLLPQEESITMSHIQNSYLRCPPNPISFLSNGIELTPRSISFLSFSTDPSIHPRSESTSTPYI